MTAIQRFAIHGTIMNPHSNGPYVRHEDHLAAMQGRCLAKIEEPAPATFMTKDRACEWAWDKVREEVGTKGWTTGDSCNFYGFFLHGWNYRGQYELQRSTAIAAIKQELMTAAPALEAPAAPVSTYVEVRECSGCGHVGINDADGSKAACNTCDWQGDSPREDKCPGCHAVGTMTSACPECGARTSLLADTHLLAAAPQAPVDDLAALVKQLVQALRKAAPNHALPAKALDYLRRQGLLGSPLRAAPEAPPTHAGLLAAAAHIRQKANAFAEECGSYDPDTGAFEMRDAVQEHYNTLDELAEEIRLMADKAAPAAPAVDALDAARLDWLEEQAKQSPTGISFDYVRHAEDGQVLEKGWRFMRRHFLGERKSNLRAAIDAAQAAAKGEHDE